MACGDTVVTWRNCAHEARGHFLLCSALLCSHLNLQWGDFPSCPVLSIVLMHLCLRSLLLALGLLLQSLDSQLAIAAPALKESMTQRD